jgi:RimJ/RimL family protein N-acetyltransferase
MSDYQLNTPRLALLPLSLEWLEAMKMGREKFKSITGYKLPEPFTEFPESLDHSIQQLQSIQFTPPWISYAIVRPVDPVYIGQCGFKGYPDKGGCVEIGYEVAKEFRLQGYAHEVIRCLIREAFRHPEINTILAHTLPLKNESNHLLIKNHFVFQKEIEDPDDGLVWQWILKRAAYRFVGLQGE